MKHKKLMAIVCALGIFTLNMISLTAYATGLENSTTNDEEGRAAGLIMSYSLSITGGTKTVYLTADTAGYDTMAKIGFTNIVVQHSTNGTSGWTDEVPRDRDLATNTIYANHDGVMTQTDNTVVLQHITSISPITNNLDKYLADVTKDNVVDVSDAVLIAQIIDE